MTLHRKTYWFHGIQARISFILLLTTTLIFSGFMVNYYHSTRDQMNSEIDESGDFFANHLSISLAKPLWDTDANAIEGVLEATMKEKQVYAIFIRDNLDKFYGKIRDAQWRSIPLREDIFPEESVRKQKEVVWQDEMLGTVQVCLTPKFMQKKLNEAIADMLITLAVLEYAAFSAAFFQYQENHYPADTGDRLVSQKYISRRDAGKNKRAKIQGRI